MTDEIKKNTTSTQSKPIKIGDEVSIKIKSGFYGVLRYKNPRSGESFIWEHIGDIQFLSMSDLKTIKAQDVNYYKNQWMIIAGVADGSDCKAKPEDIYKALAVENYYKNFIDPNTFNCACDWAEIEIADKIELLTDGARQNLIVALNGFIKDGTLDSRKKIKVFEKALDCELQANN